jgi:DNA polymerase III alpha subunit (gram-positive type)
MDDQHLLRFNKTKTLTFFDFETLNLCLNFCHNLPWQLGMVKVKGDQIIESKDILIKWNTHLRISEGAARITRYDQSKVDRLGITPDEAFGLMDEWLNDCDHVFAHNGVGFDLPLVKEWYKSYESDGWKAIRDKLIDTNLIAKGIKLGMPYKATENLFSYQYRMYHHVQKGLKTSLTTLGKEFEIPHNYENLHDAVCDLELNVKVWNKLKWQVEI